MYRSMSDFICLVSRRWLDRKISSVVALYVRVNIGIGCRPGASCGKFKVRRDRSFEELARAAQPDQYRERERAGRDRSSKRLAHAEQLHIEDQGRVRGDWVGAVRAIAEIRRDYQLSLPADFHRHHAFVPAFDHLPDADGELEGLTAIDGTVKLGPVFEPAGVM